MTRAAGLWIRTAGFDAPPTLEEPADAPPLVLKTSAELDEELIDLQIAYDVQFLREQGLRAEADNFAEKLKAPTIYPRSIP